MYCLKVNMGYGDTPWGAIRYQELELYAASNAVRDYEGTFDTAKGGTFEVSFKKGLKNTLQTMQILVKPAGYVDVSSDAWYYEAVNYVTAKCLMIGTDANVFSPNMNLTRGQMVTILYRMANSPAVEGTAPFTDVAEGRYFADAVVWAYQNGIAKGMTDTAFGPDSDITREQMVTFLYRFAEKNGVDMSQEAGLSGFEDAGKVSTFAKDAMAWAVANELVVGVTAKTLQPKGTAARAQVATVIMRYAKTF